MTIRGASMDDLLEMTVAEAARFLHREQRLHAILQVADANGLGSCRLSASVRELDDLQILRAVLAGFGGRADRRDLFIVERPGAGEDANGALQLNRALRRLTARGATVIATHAAAVTPATADWLLCMERSEGAECGLVVTCKAASATA